MTTSGEPAAVFAARLRDLRRTAGNPTYDAMSRRLNAAVSPAALSAAARGDRLPSWNTVHGFVLACDAEPADIVDDFVRAGGTIPESVRHTLADSTAGEIPQRDNEKPRASGAGVRRPWRTIIGATVVLLFTIALTAVITTIVVNHAQPTQMLANLLSYVWQDQAGPGCGGNPVDLEPPNLPGQGWGGKAAEPSRPGASPAPDRPCSTSSSWVPLADAGAGHWTHSATWTFEPGPNLTCQFRIYVPAIPQASGIATYDVYAGDKTAPSAPQSFALRQSEYHGNWVTEGPFTFTDQHIRVVLTNQSTTSGIIAISSIHAYCH